jgi:hypothetical protein
MREHDFKTFSVKFRDRASRDEEWFFIGYTVADAFDAYKEFKPDGAELVSISEKPMWD